MRVLDIDRQVIREIAYARVEDNRLVFKSKDGERYDSDPYEDNDDALEALTCLLVNGYLAVKELIWKGRFTF